MSKARIAITWLVTTALLVGAGITTAVMANAAVTLFTANAEVRVRTAANTSSKILHLLKKGDVVEGKGKAKNGWQPVSFANTTGYVYAQYVKSTKSTKTPITKAAPSTRKTSANVHLRTAPNLKSTIVRVLKKGTSVATTGRVSGDFTEVKVDGKLRWLFSQYVGGTTSKPAPSETVTPGTAKTLVNVNLRTAANLNSKITRVLKQGTTVTTTGRTSGDFTEVKVNGTTGWLYSRYVGAATANPTDPKPADPKPSEPATPDSVATVITASLLALRSSASEAAASLGDLAANTQVGLTGKHSGSYSEVIVDGKTAWVLTGYLKPSSDNPTVTLPSAIGLRYINATDVNVRKAADVESTKLATLPRGTVLQATGPTANQYTQVIFSGGLAWVASQYLSTTKPAASLGSTSLDKLKANGKAAVLVVRDKFPEIKTIHGWRASSAYSSDHPNGRAIDIMIPSYKKNKALGDRIAKYFIDNHKSLKVKYVIWRQRNYTISRGKWVNMADRGGDTANHYDHVHVSFLS